MSGEAQGSEAFGYNYRMKVKTSVTLEPSTLQEIDELATGAGSRSQIVEEALEEYLARRKREARESRDLEILNRTAEALNSEMEDILGYQVDL